MKIIPAIDIKGGKVVRLIQGLADKEKVYFESPLDVAKLWESQGAEIIHVVDLDGAFEGSLKNLSIVGKMARSVKSKIELGGGIRDQGTIKQCIDAGVARVVIGTKALEKDFIDSAVRTFKDKIVVGIDAKNGVVYTKGWIAESNITAIDLAKKMEVAGVKTIIYTDIAKDGMLEGPNIDSLKELLNGTNLDIIASGGVSNMNDLKRLKNLNNDRLSGVIIGKALYEKKIDLKEAIKECSQKE